MQGVKASRGPGSFGVPIRGFPQPLAPWDPPGGSLFLRWPSLPQPPSWASGSCPDRPRPCRFLPLSSQGLPGRKFILGAGSLGAAPKGLWKMSRVQGFGLWIPAPAQVHGDQKCGSDPLVHCTDCHLDALQRCYFLCAPWCGFGTRGNDGITSARCLHVF